jgi:hypothetical protein
MSPPSFRATVTTLAAGQLLCWAALYCAFSCFMLPMQRAFGWSKPQMMGAFTLGLAVWGAATCAVGAVMTALTLVGGFASTLSFPAAAWLRSLFDWRGALAVIGTVLVLPIAPLHAWALRGTPLVHRAAAKHDAADDAALVEALREPSCWLLTVTLTLYSFAAAALWVHVMPGFAAKGLSQAQALVVVVWFGPAQVAGRLGYLGFGPWVSARSLGLIVRGGLQVSLVIFALADRMFALLVFALLFGVANGLATIVRDSLVPEYCGREHVGRVSGAMGGSTLLAPASAPLATAWLLLALAGDRKTLPVRSATGVEAVVWRSRWQRSRRAERASEALAQRHRLVLALHLEAGEKTVAEQDEFHLRRHDHRFDVVDDHVADAHFTEPHPVGRHFAVGSADVQALALAVVQAEVFRFGKAHRHTGRAGVDDKTHGLAVDRARGHEMPAAAGREHDLRTAAGAGLAAQADLRAAHHHGHSLALDLDDSVVAGHADELHALHGGAGGDGARRAVDHQQGLVTEAAAHRDRLGKSCGTGEKTDNGEQAAHEVPVSGGSC